MKKIIFGILISSLSFTVDAQVRIMDFSLVPEYIAGASVSSDSVEVVVKFKINKADSASKTHIYLGTQNDLADVKSVVALFVKVNGDYSLEFHGVKNKIQAYAARVIIPLSRQQFNTITHATLFIETLNGNNTSRLYTRK